MAEVKYANRRGVADALGVSMVTVDELVRKGMPYVKRGQRGVEWKFDLPEVVKWYGIFRGGSSRKVPPQPTPGQMTEEDWKTRKVAAEAQKAELELAKLQGLLAPLDQVERMVSRAFGEVRAGMRNIPGRVVTRLIGETDERVFKATLLEEIDGALRALSTASLSEPEDEEEDEPNA